MACAPSQIRRHPSPAVEITRQTAVDTPLSIRMTNGTVDLTIVPAWGGRIMRYGYVGEPNVLWNATPQSLAAGKWSGWINRGGDKSWVWPQADWQNRIKRVWPPPEEFDSAAWTETSAATGEVTLLSPPLPHFKNAQIRRRFAMKPTGTEVTVETEILMRDRSASDASNPIAPWEVTQVAMPIAVLRPATRPSNHVEIVRPRQAGQSGISEADVDALGAVEEKVLLVQRLHQSNTLSRLYIDPQPNHPAEAYVELEWLSKPARPPQPVVVEWELFRRTGTAVTSTDIDLMKH